MNSDVSSAGLDVSLEVVLLRGVEHVASGVQENDGAISSEILRCEGAGVFCRIDGESVFLSQLPDRGQPILDGAMPVSGCLREDEYAGILCLCGHRAEERNEKNRERKESLHGRFQGDA